MKIDLPNNIARLIDQHHEQQSEPPRPHMGCSVLGHPCDRWLWLSFRWAVIEQFPGRMLRLFRRGHLEETQMLADLAAIGVVIDTTQERVDFGGHISGSLDGIAASGVPCAEKARHVLEFKTHSEKSFKELAAKGVHAAKPMHWAQMQLYMLGTGLKRALYVAVNKNTDELHAERVKFDKAAAEKILERGRRIVAANEMPEPLSRDPSWYQCKWCPAHDLCHGSKLTREVNCRTCAHSTAMPNSTWRCERWDFDRIPLDNQRTGCEAHTIHPDLVPWEQGDSPDGLTAVYIIDGKPVENKNSRELIKNAQGLSTTGN